MVFAARVVDRISFHIVDNFALWSKAAVSRTAVLALLDFG
jgi:hypothetical protein